jgi:hypothetical protein
MGSEVHIWQSRVMAQSVSWPLTAEARIRARVSRCGICGGNSGTGTGFFLQVLWFSPVNIISSCSPYTYNINWGMNNKSVGGRTSETISLHRSEQHILNVVAHLESQPFSITD